MVVTKQRELISARETSHELNYTDPKRMYVIALVEFMYLVVTQMPIK